MKKFWNWIKDSDETRTLRLEGPIDEESFWGDEITPQMFRDELNAGEGDVTVWINSPGGNVLVDYYTCFAYASTYEATEEDGEVTAEQKSVVFTVRWCSEVNKLTSTGFRVLFRGELYDITSVDPMNYDKKTTKLHCRLERRQR